MPWRIISSIERRHKSHCCHPISLVSCINNSVLAGVETVLTLTSFIHYQCMTACSPQYAQAGITLPLPQASSFNVGHMSNKIYASLRPLTQAQLRGWSAMNRSANNMMRFTLPEASSDGLKLMLKRSSLWHPVKIRQIFCVCLCFDWPCESRCATSQRKRFCASFLWTRDTSL